MSNETQSGDWSDGMSIIDDFFKEIDEANVKKFEYTMLWNEVRKFLDATASTKPWSAKNLQKLMRKVFSIKLSENSHMFAQITEISAKKLVRPSASNGPTVKAIEIMWVSTPKGKIYSAVLSNSPMCIIVLSHVFDRMSQRAYDSELTRLQAMREFFWGILSSGGQVFTNSGHETMLFTDKGLFLGCGYVISNSGEATPLVADAFSAEISNGKTAVLVLKTFVNDLKPWQEKKKQWLAEKGGYEWKVDLTNQHAPPTTRYLR